jgi:hypothetical protein
MVTNPGYLRYKAVLFISSSVDQAIQVMTVGTSRVTDFAASHTSARVRLPASMMSILQ